VGFLVTPLGLVVAGLAAAAGAGAYFAYQSGLLGDVLDALREKFGPLLSAAKEAFEGIKAALANGDIAAAADILWKALRVAWLNGRHALLTIWDKTTDGFAAAWDRLV